MLKIIPLVLYIGIFPIGLNAEVVEPSLEYLEQNKLVFVEPTNMIVGKVKDQYVLVPYKERRKRWGVLVEAGYCTYEPMRYEPNFSNKLYKEVYGRPETGMLEVKLTVKRNFAAGSLGAELSVSSFQNKNSNPLFVGSELTMTPIQIGASYFMDRLWDEPYVVPFVTGGAYTVIFHEILGGQGFHGNTAVAPYFNGGVAFQLDWIDPKAARVGLQDTSLQSSYIYLEARKYFASTSKKDPDFSNDIAGAAGVRVEF